MSGSQASRVSSVVVSPDMGNLTVASDVLPDRSRAPATRVSRVDSVRARSSWRRWRSRFLTTEDRWTPRSSRETLRRGTDAGHRHVLLPALSEVLGRRKVRLIGRGQVGAGRVYQVVSGHAACATVPRPHVRWLGEPPPRRSDRVSPGGESGPPGIPGPSAASPDRRPASATRCARPQTRPASPQAGRGHRHPGHDPSLVPETDRQEIRRQRLPPSRAADDAQRSRRARGQDGGRESAVGLHTDPRRALEPRAHDRPDHGEADLARPRDRPGSRTRGLDTRRRAWQRRLPSESAQGHRRRDVNYLRG